MRSTRFAALGLAACVYAAAQAATYPVSFTKLAGVTGGTPANTAVYRADLSGLPVAEILSLQIGDSNSGVGGSAGMYSGFDLDAVRLSDTSVGTAADATALAGLPVLDFSSGAIFTPGTQRAPADPNLFGAVGNVIDNSVATLGAFDGNAVTGLGAFGFLSLGDGGALILNLTAPVAPAGSYLYIGEVGDNGELAAASITVSDTRIPEPGTMALLGVGLLPLLRRRKRA